MLQIQTKLKISVLLDPYTFKSLNLAKNLQKFFTISDNNQFSFLKKPINEQKLYIKNSLNLLTKPLNITIDKIWVESLFIDTLLSTCHSSLLTKELIEFFIDVCDQLNNSLNKLKAQKVTKNSFFTSKICTGISKLKSIINKSATFTHGQFTPTNSSKILSHSKFINTNEILMSILDSVLSYQRKKLQSFDFIRLIKSRYEINQTIIGDNQVFENLVENVWKIINLIRFHSTIIESYKKIAHMSQEMNPFILATFIRLCKDSLLLYPYIVQSIEIGAKNIKQKYDSVLSQKLPKEIKKVKLQNLSRKIVFIEVDNMIQELTSINETIFYMFCGKTHFQYLNIKIPKNFFLNTTNRKLDDIHMILREVHQASQKHQKSKIYISQMVEKLDESVSKVVEKEKLKQSLIDIVRPQIYVEQSNPKNEEEEKERGRKKIPTIFEEITEEI